MAEEKLQDKAKPEKPEMNEIATAKKDIDIFAGYLKRLENPDPVLRTESGGKGIRLYDEVARDPHAFSVLQSRYMAVVGKEWEIVPGKSAVENGVPVPSEKDREIAATVEMVLTGCNFEQFRQEILQGILYGYKGAEILWEYRDGMIAIRKILGKHPRRFCFTPERELRLLTPESMIEGEEVPRRKFIVFTYGDSDNPYGNGLGRILWWPVWFKKNGIKFWLIFLEKFGQPSIVGKYPPGTMKDKQDDLLEAIELIHTETGITIPENMAIELLEAARTGKASYREMCDYMDAASSKVVLSETLTTQVGEAGSYAASNTHSDVKQEITEADADLLDECLNESLIQWIVDYNHPGVTSYPMIITHAGRKQDLKGRSEIDKTLVKDIGLPVSRQYFYETYGIPAPAEGEEIIEGSDKGQLYEYHFKYPLVRVNEVRQRLGLPLLERKQGEKFVYFAQEGGGALGTGQPSPLFSERERGLNEAQATPEMYTEQLEGAAHKYLDEIIDQVKNLVMNSSSFEEIRDGLLDLYPEMDALKLGELMQQAFVAAELAGRYDVKEGK